MPPRMKKKGKTGAAKNYITRNQALKKLQLSLADFRKLCIWKGIFPREPRNRKKANKSATYSTTFYYAKDIQYLLHEPLINKFRDLKALEKKISKALGRGDVGDAKRLDANAGRPDVTGKARFTLDHVIRERYPTFNDALRDLDDCLSMLFLFANLPSTDSVPAKVIARCERLCLEFEHYCITSHSLRKSFLSIKGIYYQATINGEDILWLVPYKFNQRVTQDVDYRIMGTFVEFYITLLTFVNFRLYTKQGLRYPPKFDQNKDNQSAELGAFTLEGRGIVEEPKQITESASSGVQVDTATQAAVNAIVKNLKSAAATEDTAVVPTTITDDSTAIDKFEPAVAGGDVLPQPSYSSNDPSKLFANMTFFFSRETPRQPIEFILRAFGCKRIGWDAVLGEGAFTVNENDPIITHQIVDRPPIQVAAEEYSEMENAEDNQTSQKLSANRRVPGRVYVQPQWVWDCINDEELKPVDLYAPGAQLPPHLSPFVKPEAGRYDPTIPLADQQTEVEVLESEGEEADEDNIDEDSEGFYGVSDNEAATPKGGEESSDEEQEEDEAAVASDDEDAQRQTEIEAEMRGDTVKAKEGKAQSAKEKAKIAARKELQRKAKEEAEEKKRAMGMMSKKKRRLYEQMVYTNNKKSTEDETLRAKRRKMEKEEMKKSRV